MSTDSTRPAGETTAPAGVDRIPVLYVGGSGRSGSTLLSLLLGRADGVFNAGEIFYLWDWGLEQNRLCGCGSSFRECSFWSDILESAYGEELDRVRARVLELRRQNARTRHLGPLLLRPGAQVERPQARDLANSLYPLYREIAAQPSCDLIVDASKFPAYASVLGLIPEVDLSFIHLTRDPRAVAYSWQRRRINPDSGRPFGRRGAIKSALLWLVENRAAESLGARLGSSRYLRIRYEDIVRDPDMAFSAIGLFLSEWLKLPDIPRTGVTVEAGHTIAGNPVRFASRPLVLKEDVEWHSQLSTGARLATTAICSTLLRRFGY